MLKLNTYLRLVKRTALIFLTAIYLLSCMGIGVNRFYCCGKLASVTLTYASADHTDKGDCCKHESKSFKIKDGHVMVKTTVLGQFTPIILPIPAYGIAINFPTTHVVHTSYQANAPPGNPDIPIYTLTCTYRI